MPPMMLNSVWLRSVFTVPSFTLFTSPPPQPDRRDSDSPADRAAESAFFTVGFMKYSSSQPLTAPAMKPFSKYFWTKG